MIHRNWIPGIGDTVTVIDNVRNDPNKLTLYKITQFFTPEIRNPDDPMSMLVVVTRLSKSPIARLLEEIIVHPFLNNLYGKIIKSMNEIAGDTWYYDKNESIVTHLSYIEPAGITLEKLLTKK